MTFYDTKFPGTYGGTRQHSEAKQRSGMSFRVVGQSIAQLEQRGIVVRGALN